MHFVLLNHKYTTKRVLLLVSLLGLVGAPALFCIEQNVAVQSVAAQLPEQEKPVKAAKGSSKKKRRLNPRQRRRLARAHSKKKFPGFLAFASVGVAVVGAVAAVTGGVGFSLLLYSWGSWGGCTVGSVGAGFFHCVELVSCAAIALVGAAVTGLFGRFAHKKFKNARQESAAASVSVSTDDSFEVDSDIVELAPHASE